MSKSILMTAVATVFAFSSMGAVAAQTSAINSSASFGGLWSIMNTATSNTAAQNSVMTSPPSAPYKAVSSLVKLPDFIPGMGQLFVDPNTLPAGPFLGYDHNKKLVNTIYMIPLSQMNPNMDYKQLKAPAGTVDHVDIVYNAGHPGVEEPHIHIVLWNIPVAQESRVAK